MADKRDGVVGRAAEREMRRWALRLESQQRLAKQSKSSDLPQLIHPYLAISRECGAGGSELAQRVADESGWKLLDRELLDYIADRYHVGRAMLEFVDEKVVCWIHEIFGKWFDQQVLTQSEYVHRLGKTVFLAAQHGNTIFVGRGVQFLLPRDQGLAVRLIAPRKQRVERIMMLQDLSRKEAERFIDEADEGRAQYVRRYFLHDVADPLLYDLVINTSHMTLAVASELVVRECERRFGTMPVGA